MVATPTLHPRLQGPIDVRSPHVGLEHPRRLLATVPENPSALLALATRHIVSALQFDRELVTQLCRLAASIEMQPAPSSEQLLTHPPTGFKKGV